MKDCPRCHGTGTEVYQGLGYTCGEPGCEAGRRMGSVGGPSIRLLRGRVAIRETAMTPASPIILPKPKQDQVRIHRGTVMGVGGPRVHGNVEVPSPVKPGDEVLFHFEQLYDWGDAIWEDGEKVTCIPASCIDAVLEP